MRTAVREVLLWWAASAAVGVVLISSVDPVELAVIGATALGAACAARALRRAVGLPRLRARGVPRALLVLPWSVLRGTGVVAREVCAGGGRSGGFRRIRMRPGDGTVWAGYLAAASADTCVVGAEEPPSAEEAATVLVHALRAEPGAVERRLTGGAHR